MNLADDVESDRDGVKKTSLSRATPLASIANTFDFLTPPWSDVKRPKSPARFDKPPKEGFLDWGCLLTPPEGRNAESDPVSRLPYVVLDSLLQYLEPVDIVRFASVCKTWKRVAEANTKARSRCREYLRSIDPENFRRDAPFEEFSPIPLPKLEFPYPNGIENDIIMCPRCAFSAVRSRDQPRGQCTECNYDFCAHCFQRWSKRHKCERRRSEESAKGKVGSRESKKRLKRL